MFKRPLQQEPGIPQESKNKQTNKTKKEKTREDKYINKKRRRRREIQQKRSRGSHTHNGQTLILSHTMV